MFLLGLTGGIASGKSTVAKLLKTHGADTIDADQVARDVVEIGSPGLEAVVSQFGKSILVDSGELDREALGQLIFANSKLRAELEAILHPLIKERTTQLIAESDKSVVVYAVPLLVEAKVDYPFKMIVTVEAGVSNQIERLVRSRGLSPIQAQARTDAQATKEQRIARADFVIDSSGPIENLAPQVESLWAKIQAASGGEGN